MVNENREIQIGLWGPRAAGKTTFLAALYHELLRRSRDGWRIDPVGDEAREFVRAAHRQLFVEGRFPNPNPVDTTRIYNFRIMRPRRFMQRASKTFLLSFPDPGGEWYENYNVLKERFPEANPIRVLARCQGMILLFDPFSSLARRPSQSVHGNSIATSSLEAPSEPLRDPVEEERRAASYFEMLIDLTYELQDRELEAGADFTPRYAAVVFTKMDKTNYWRNPEPLERFAEGVLTQDDIALLENHFSRDHIRYFAASSVGVFEDEDGQRYANYEEASNRGYPEHRIPRPDKIQPFGVFEPLEWLLEMLGKNSR